MSELSNVFKKTAIEAVCAITDDERTLAIAKWWEMSPDGKAANFLNHYLAGSGSTKTVAIADLFRDDVAVRDWVAGEVKNKLVQGIKSGTVPVPQFRYSNKEWQFALGSINVNWTLISRTKDAATLRFGFRNEYRWHPKEQRITQCIHQAAENLKTKGASDYWMEGSGFAELDMKSLSRFNKIW